MIRWQARDDGHKYCDEVEHHKNDDAGRGATIIQDTDVVGPKEFERQHGLRMIKCRNCYGRSLVLPLQDDLPKNAGHKDNDTNNQADYDANTFPVVIGTPVQRKQNEYASYNEEERSDPVDKG